MPRCTNTARAETADGESLDRLRVLTDKLGSWALAPYPSRRGRWLFLRIVGVCFAAAFFALHDQVLGLIGSDGLAPFRMRVPWLQNVLGEHGLNVFLEIQPLLGLVAAFFAVAGIWSGAAFAASTALWILSLYMLGPFDAYQPDAMLASAGVCAATLAPRFVGRETSGRRLPTRAEFIMVSVLLAGIYWGSAVGKLQNPAWRSLTAMDQYWQCAPVPAWTGWYVQNYLPRFVVRATCVVVMVTEMVAPFLLFLGARGRVAFFCCNLVLQGSIAATASYSFLNLLMIGLGMLTLPEKVDLPSASVQGVPKRRTVGILTISALYTAASLVALLGRLTPASLSPLRFRAPVAGVLHVFNTYGLYEDVGRSGYRVLWQHSDDGARWTPYEYRCLPMDPQQLPRLVSPYQCRLDWFMWHVSKLGNISDTGFVSSVASGLASASPQVLSLFAAGTPQAPPPHLRGLLLEYDFSTPSDRQHGWWIIRSVAERRFR